MFNQPMIEPQYLNILRKIYSRLKDSRLNWVITGSLGMALQGLVIKVHDIDIQTDRRGAFEIEKLFPENVVTPVHYSESEQIHSYFGKLEIDGIKVEIMGDIQKQIDGQSWEEPIKVKQYRQWIEYEGMQIPVLSLEYEYQAYIKLGRLEKAEILKKWLQNQSKDSG